MSDEYGQAFVNNADQLLDGTWTYQGQENNLQVRNISYPDFKLIQQYGALAGSLENVDPEDVDDAEIEQLAEQADELDNFSWEDDDGDMDFIVSVVEEKLVRPDVNVDETDHHVLVALVEGMIATWQEDSDVQAAKGEMPVDSGNR